MGTAFKNWGLGMALFALAFSFLLLPLPIVARAEEAPTQAELDRIRAWHELYLSPTPVYRDTENHFLRLRYYSREENRAQQEFFRQPQTKKILEETRKDLSAFVDSVANGARDSGAIGREIPLDPGAEMVHSFERFQQENLRHKKGITEPEAERLARYEIERRYGRLDLQDFNQRREFEREKNRFLLSAEGRKAAPRLSEADFNEWRLRELERVRAAREANMGKLAALSLEFDPGGLMVGRAAADGTLQSAALRSLTAEDLDGAKFEYRPIGLKPGEIIRLEGQKKIATAWFLRLKGGEELGLMHANGSFVQHKLPNAAAAAYSMDEFFRASKGERERRFAHFSAANAEDGFEELRGTLKDKIRFRPDPRELEALIAQGAREVKNAKARLMGQMHWDSQVLFARGLLKDPNYWKKRDAQAREMGAKKFPLGRDTPPRVGLFSAWAREGGGGGRRPDFGGARSTLSLSGGATSPENTAREAQAAAEKNTLFKTDKLIPGKGPGFYSLFDSTAIAGAKTVELSRGRATISVSSAQSFQPRAGLMTIPTPEGHELARLELRSLEGRVLEPGRDYQVLKGEGGYALKLNSADELYDFRAGFSPVRNANEPAPSLLALDHARLRKLQAELHRAKLDALAGALGELLEKGKVSVFDLERLFKSASLYSFNPEPNLPDRLQAAEGTFKGYTRFANGEGQACFQCDGSNSLFRDLLQEYFGGEARVKSVSGFQSPYRSLKESHLHQITMVEVPGYPPLKLDATPVKMDRALPGAGERIIAQQTKLAPEPARPKPVYVENFRRELEETKTRFLKLAEPAGLKFNKGDPWLNAGKAAAVLDSYLAGSHSLEEAGEELKRFFPGRKMEFATHEEFMRSLSALGREERETLAKVQSFARENPHIPGGAGYRSSTIVAATDKRLELLARAEESLTAENLAEYRAASAKVPAQECAGMFGALGK